MTYVLEVCTGPCFSTRPSAIAEKLSPIQPGPHLIGPSPALRGRLQTGRDSRVKTGQAGREDGPGPAWQARFQLTLNAISLQGVVLEESGKHQKLKLIRRIET